MNEFYTIKETNGEYLINKKGEVFSVRRGRVLKPFLSGEYPSVSINGKRRYIHRLMAAQFLGNIEGLTVNHKDLNKHNNSLDNLEIVTQAENNRHARENLEFKQRDLSTYPKGEDATYCKLTNNDVLAIMEKIKLGESIIEIAKEYGVSFQNVSMIKTGKTWSHLTGGAIEVNGRQCIKGAGNPSSVSRDKAMQALKMLNNGDSVKDVVCATGLGKTTVTHIKMGRHWINSSNSKHR